MSPDAKVMLWVLGRIDELKREGLIDGGTLDVKIKGSFEYRMLMENGFRPSDRDVESAIGYLTEGMCLEDREVMLELVLRYP